ncbi:PiggyBac transposable element-derived protein 4-like [Plakobranchus ocellatus]|uniref:PiggyBac transposable element-derived protein 4-like n=1 Tax=Plakobranchus ocellatus TaxID=259542 RepID=A0AAV4APQ2_9GAST|nr:PiggyBac transposable element-derived protein 4-like [Plakobranchus ocellatus]
MVTEVDDSDLPLTDDDNTFVDEGAAAGDNAFRVWMNIVGDDLGPPNVEFTVNSGPRIHLPKGSESIDYLQLFITNFSLDKIVTEINRYAQQWIEGAHIEADRGEENVTHNLVIRLLQEARLLYSGHHVGMDNYFSSPKLFLELFRANTKATGTVRSNGKGLPKAILKKNTA